MGDLKIITITRGYIPRMRTHKMCFPGCEQHFIFHTDLDRQRVCKSLNIPLEYAHVSNTPPGLDGCAKQREWAERNLISLGEWYVSLDDNYSHFTCVPEPWYWKESIDFDFDWECGGHKCFDFRKAYDTVIESAKVVERWYELIEKCISRGTVYGCGTIDKNYFYRSVKWQHIGYCHGGNSVSKNVGLSWTYWDGCMVEDLARTLDVITKYGSICMNRFFRGWKPDHEIGGVGSPEDREPGLIDACQRLMIQYPGLLRQNKNRPYQVAFTKTTLKSLNKWRAEHGY